MLGFLFGIDKNVTIFAAFNIKLHRRASEPAVQVGIFYVYTLRINISRLSNPVWSINVPIAYVISVEQREVDSRFSVFTHYPITMPLICSIWQKKLLMS